MDLAKRFEQEQVWEIDPSKDPHWRQKAELVRALIQPNVETILDVGCGNGALTHFLARDLVIYGLDGSRAALARVRVPAAAAWADRIPIRDRAVDLVLCSEVLEHLPTLILHRAVAELARISRRWLLVTVPFDEQLAVRYVWCDHCRRPFHIYGHVQRFTMARLRKLFRGWQLEAWIHCGDYGIGYHPWLLRIRQHLGKHWFFYEPASPICPYCQATTFELHEGGRISYYCDRLNKRFYGGERARHPYWILTLWERPRQTAV